MKTPSSPIHVRSAASLLAQKPRRSFQPPKLAAKLRRLTFQTITQRTPLKGGKKTCLVLHGPSQTFSHHFTLYARQYITHHRTRPTQSVGNSAKTKAEHERRLGPLPFATATLPSCLLLVSAMIRNGSAYRWLSLDIYDSVSN